MDFAVIVNRWIKYLHINKILSYFHDRCFLYAVTAAQNTEQIQSHSERISNIKSY